MAKFRIIADSSCDLQQDYIDRPDVDLKIVPFILSMGDKDFIDDETLDVDAMFEAYELAEGKTGSACPSPQTYLDAAEGCEYNFIVTISSNLSGSYNSACVARDTAAADGRKIFVVDSKATSGVEVLIIDELVRMIDKGLPYDEICKKIAEYGDSRNLIFVLRKFDNLIRNGRMLKIVAKVATALNITPICIKSPIGTIDVKEKCIGAKKTERKMIDMLGEMSGEAPEEIIINHCYGEEEAKILETKLRERFRQVKNVRIIPTRGLASYYALQKGIILSF